MILRLYPASFIEDEGALRGVASFGICCCELSVNFKKCHLYTSINEIAAIFEKAHLTIGNFYFKGLSAYDFVEEPDGTLTPLDGREYQEDGPTKIVCLIPEHLRDTFYAHAIDTDPYSY
jgi:hypothetical protein